MNLEKYTKSELIEAIEMLTGGSRSELERCLYCIDENRVKTLCDEADRLNKMSAEASQQYIDILKPYNGKRIIEIPLDVMEKADDYINKAHALDRQWSKIMKKIERMNNHE